ncbi:ImmA/IrrE family metallo-endopeptidase [Oceanobacillus sp. AG]|uniref:ImmA/IrrE family metallo-endopeptidase n=1 Tax=Oceanobacillus sp. AG TaxID=2681969 RepID=UPI0012EC6065|nr:ImmA/IrrE family metallo-endopeptidase [Oceanobacillus sp. AG]
MANRAPVKAELIEWAYNRSMRQEYLHNKFTKLSDWLGGELQPTLRQLEEFAKATSTPLGYFFLEHPPVEELPIPHYRTIEDGGREQPSPDLIETLHMMQRRQDFIRDYFERYVGDTLSFVGSYKGTSVRELTEKINQILEIDSEWAKSQKTYQDALNYLTDRCERKRIMVMINGIVGYNTQRPLDVEEFRGFVLVDNMAPLIFINGKDAKSAQIFTLIHEIAHIAIGSSAVVEAHPLNRVNEDAEVLCNNAAAEFLCPMDAFQSAWHSHYGDGEVYKTLANIFKVSPIVIGRRALDLNIITRAEFFRFYHSYIEEIQRDLGPANPSGGNFYNNTRIRLGSLFSRVINYETKSGALQYTDAYNLTGLKRTTFERYMNFMEERGV